MQCFLLSSSAFLLLLLLLLHLLPSSLGDPRITPSLLLCSIPSTAAATSNATSKTTTAATSSSFIPTFVSQMSHLSQVMSSGHHFATTSTPPRPLSFHALAQCHADLSQTDCLLCFAAARTLLPRCLPSPSALLFLDGCFLRYSAASPSPFFSETSDSSIDRVNCTATTSSDDEGEGGDIISDSTRVTKAVGEVVKAVKAVREWSREEGGFGAVGYQGVYVMGQCWGSVGRRACEECLIRAGKEVVKECVGKVKSKEGRGLFAGCYLRYSNVQFFNDKKSGGNEFGND